MRWKLLLLLTALLLIPSLVIGAPVYPLSVSSDNRHLVDQNGVPFFVVGDSPASIAVALTPSQVDTYISSRQAKGFNTVLYGLIDPIMGGGSSHMENQDGDAPFSDPTDFSTLNTGTGEYWDDLDEIVQAFEDAGFYQMVYPYWGGYACQGYQTEGNCADMKAMTTTTLYDYGAFVGNRYKDVEGLMWVHGGDIDPSADAFTTQTIQVYNGIVSADTTHLHTSWPRRRDLCSDDVYGTIIDANCGYSLYASGMSDMENAHDYSPTTPSMYMEGYYEGGDNYYAGTTNITLEQVRQQMWFALLGGQFGHVYGHEAVWDFETDDDEGTWEDAMNSEGAQSMKIWADFVHSISWTLLEPDFDHSIMTSGYSGYYDSSAGAAAADTSDLVVAWIPENRPVTINFDNLSDDIDSGWWMDPSDGTVSVIGTDISTSGSQMFTPPSSGDWVLVLEKTAQSQTWYKDQDGDQYSDGTSQNSVSRPSGYFLASELIATSGDCNDGDGDIHPGAEEACNGMDDDCDSDTLDGIDDPFYGSSCDGPDADSCTEGTYGCVDGSRSCSDNTGDILDVCDGQDNDCNAATADGSDESWLGDACDGTDSDLCTEGSYTCTGGAQSCSDISGDTLDTCDGLDNDCNPATADGADESWLGTDCDGTDSDLCDEGTFSCTGGTQTCSDNTGDNVEICGDGIDQDCSGSDLPCDPTWYKDTDGDDYSDGTSIVQATQPAGYYLPADLIATTGDCNDGDDNIHPGATEVCNGVNDDCDTGTPDGADATWLGGACDGTDTDLCTEGTYTCVSGAQFCGDITGDTLDICDGQDNDCNAATADGSGELWLGDACDGTDTDLCTEGTFSCTGGSQSCSDTTGDILDICDGLDNDCNSATADGSDETWLGDACDGTDSDLCDEGTFSCTGGTQTCSDNTGDNVEICGDGIDQDCNGSDLPCDPTWYKDTDGDDYSDGTSIVQATQPAGYYLPADLIATTGDCNDGDDNIHPGATEVCNGVNDDCDTGTPDGADATWLGDACDGTDTDLCTEGTYTCVSGAQFCGDITGDTLDLCNGVDDDCNPATTDGSGESWLGDACDGTDADLCTEGTLSCENGTQACSDDTGDTLDTCDGLDNDCNPATADGADESWLGTDCDGTDSDLCDEGTFSCTGGTQTCSDNTGDNVEICGDGIDQDCNGSDLPCDPTWYKDTDGDDYSDGTSIVQATQPAGYYLPADLIATTGDCNDGDDNIHPGAAEACNGVNDDCDTGTPDGADATWLGDACDGTDTDLCTEGTYTCVSGAQFCGDITGDTLDICDGQDNDCNPATTDGSGESWLGDACDGTDADLCTEGTLSCESGAQTCSDQTGDIIEICDDTLDNDCDGMVDANDADCFSSEPNTPAGSNVTVQPVDPVTGADFVQITFEEVLNSGDTRLEISQDGPKPPSGYKLSNPHSTFDLSTTALFSGLIETCIDYNGLHFGNEKKMKLFHRFDADGDGIGDAWEDVTTYHDMDGNIICGVADSFSSFGVFEEDDPYAVLSEDSGSGGCFVATAAYGSYLDPHVKTLRRFRDNYLLKNTVGRQFVRLYYRYSPPTARWLAGRAGLKAVVRVALLPLVAIAWLMVNAGTEAGLLLLGLICILMSLGLRRSYTWWHGRQEDVSRA